MKRRFLFLIALVAITLTSVAQPQKFLADEQLPDAVQFLPGPPDVTTPLFFNDWTQYQWGKSVRDSDRGQLAYFDAKHGSWYNIFEVFEAEFGMKVTPDGTPAIYDVVSRAVSDGHAVNRRAKNYYQRKRPFVQFNEPSLEPEKEEEEAKDFSYPSGHTSRGWMVALVLSEINPEATAALFKRACTFGESRVIAGYHYQSDVEASRLVAMSTFVTLHGNAEFMKSLEAAKKEFQKLKKSNK